MESDSSSRSLELDSLTLSRQPVGLFPKRVSQFSSIHKKQVWGRISESHTDWKWLSERDKILYLVWQSGLSREGGGLDRDSKISWRE